MVLLAPVGKGKSDIKDDPWGFSLSTSAKGGIFT